MDRPLSKPTVHELVESLGMGPAQISVILLGVGGIHFVYGASFTCLNIISVSAAAEMNVSSGARGLLITNASMGLLIGAVVASAGDALGRLRCITTGYIMMAVSLVMTAATMNSWFLMVLACGGTGFGVGIGLGPSIVMLSEMTPDRWKLTVRICSSAMYIFGVQSSALLAGLDDPTLQALTWRKLLLYAAVPPTILAILSSALLPESPVLQAAKGQHSDAYHGFQWMAEQNGQKHVIIDYQELPQIGSSLTGPGLYERLQVVFSGKYAFSLFAATLADFVINLAEKGRAYANPQIFGEVSTLPAAWQILVSDLPAQVTALLVVVIFLDLCARKVAVMIALCLMALGSFCTCVAGVQPLPRSPFTESVFQLALMSLAGGCKMGFAVLYQLAVEIFHPAVAATGSAVVICLGRFGSIAAPTMFEICQAKFGWPVFYYTIAVMSMIAAVFMWRVPSAAELEVESVEDAHDAGSLLMNSSPTYGTISKLA
mmetsp:Transcript_89873/g.155606  ORF Transcript_89873/g.155606 Transcript_89873/m.155606 type:complete len:487 (+) Transcript_89873:71-1531(+)